jgi:hypothetical protein
MSTMGLTSVKGLHWLAAVLVTAALVACGGGGGGGGADNPSGITPVSYSGSTSPSTLTTTNAATVSGSALVGGEIGTSVPVGAAPQGETTSGENRSARVAQIIQRSVTRAVGRTDTGDVTGAQHSVSRTYSCAVSGTVAESLTVDDQTGDFSGALTFSNCSDEPGEAVSGQIVVAGHFDGIQTTNPQLTSVTISGTLSVTEGTDSYTFTGTIAMMFTWVSSSALSPSSVTVSENIDIRSGSSLYFRVRNYIVTVTYASTYHDVEIISGEFCHSVHGCVTVVTEAPFRYYGNDLWPTSGALVVTGAAGRRVRLTALNNTTYQVEWDLDGIAGYEGSATGTWGSL